MQHTLFSACSLLFIVASALGGSEKPPPSPAPDVLGPQHDLPRIPARSPVKAAHTFTLQDGFRMELLASEPLVTDPVALQYDENGLAYVVEMNDYPYADPSHDAPFDEQQSEPGGRIRILEDTDGDGQLDKGTVFADALSWPTGLAFWKGGVFVTATPHLWYLKDTDGDRRADMRRKVFTGFRKYNVQAVMNNLKWGIDHKIYAAGSSNGGDIQAAGSPSATPIRLGARDFRFAPDGGSLEPIAGGARFGNAFDDWSHRFICNIRNPIRHVVIPSRYLSRNPFHAVRSVLHDVAESGDAVPVYRTSRPEPWRIINAERLATDRTRRSPRSETAAAGFITSCTGVTVYRGAAYPPAYYGNVFVGEVAGNLVMRYTLSARGPTFQAQRTYADREFLTSSDNWFRPVNFVNAPDGTLHLLDMYRETIEHPWSIPDDIQQQLDLTSGRDRGRIYRILPARYAPGFRPPPRPRLGTASIEHLVHALSSPNGWWRDTAHRLIYERQDGDAVPLLRTLLQTSCDARSRLLALWSLEGLRALKQPDLVLGLSDRNAAIRMHSIVLAESRLERLPELLERIVDTVEDDDVGVRLQAALTLGALTDKRAVDGLARIARRDGADPWMRHAVACASPRASGQILMELLAEPDAARRPAELLILQRLASIAGARHNRQEITTILTQLVPTRAPGSPDTRAGTRLERTLLLGLAEGLRRGGRRLVEYVPDSNSVLAQFVRRSLSLAETTALDVQLPVSERQQAAHLLSHADTTQARSVLLQLLDPREPSSLQTVAVESLAAYQDAHLTNALLERFAQFTPALRRTVIDRLLSRPSSVRLLLKAVKQGRVAVGEIPPFRRALLMKSRDPEIAARAKNLFGSEIPTPRRPVLAQYRQALSLSADLDRGDKVYRRACSSCHRWQKQGHAVGPDLATVRHRSPREILTQILNPNREVSPDYLQYIVGMKDGRVRTGIIAEETANAITLRREEGQEETILRREIESLVSSGKSLMPEGLEEKLSLQDMADLLALLAAPGER